MLNGRVGSRKWSVWMMGVGAGLVLIGFLYLVPKGEMVGGGDEKEDLDEEVLRGKEEVFRQFYNVASWDLETLKSLHTEMKRYALNGTKEHDLEGFSAELLPEVVFMFNTARETKPKTICEIGFNAGHSCATFITATADYDTKYIGFDLHEHDYGGPNFDILNALFPGRISINWGDSTKTVKPYFEANPDVKCDLLHIDGGHFGNVPLEDLRNMMLGASQNNVVLMDDVHCDRRWCNAPQAAWDQALKEGWIQETECHDQTTNPDIPLSRGFCGGKYVLA